jgi:hypothetical protein
MEYLIIMRNVGRTVWSQAWDAMGIAFDRLFENPMILVAVVVGVVLLAVWLLRLE